ncbi:hypothetical protein ES692_05000 [Psychroserpens burtonensis]|uniref:Uncharacterized protein n=1 Tax=Psychroserpens burtonensis TaxID=49278 RepID=A0A5C7BIF6_9FLAO|nr:DUF6090 family protein [Psychroserpens burtonensis]TXE18812.1 hypothetical protein ES692_05000 [Psychroserpens burtonensis]
MIKLFRNTRKSLIKENQTTKYLLYALGEIILVVFGILIALQINNWSENRKQRTIEKVYIENIKIDLKLNLKSLKNFIAERNNTITSVELVLDFFNAKKTLDVDAFNFHSLTVMEWYPFENNDNTYQELLNSGQLSILSNKTMKDSLQNLQNNLSIIRFIESEMEEDYERYLYDKFFEIIDLDTSIENLKAQVSKSETLPELELTEVKTLLENRTFKNGFVLAQFNSEDLIVEYKNMMNTTEQIIILINQELDK